MVVGLHLDKNDVRFVEVMDRTDETLTNVLQKYVQDGSVIDTDKWSGYNRLEDNGYIHFIVNYSENNFNPGTGYHIQRIERALVDAKAYMKRVRGHTHLLQYHLDELSWRKSVSNSEKDIMTDYWNDVSLVHDS